MPLPADAGGAPMDAAMPGRGRPDAAPADPSCVPSKLYGRMGELWKPDGRLIEGGYAGYHTGLDPLPVVEGPVKRVTDFGAKPDDVGDDTEAFRAALAGTPSGVLLVPAGRYVLTKQLILKDRSNFVVIFVGTGIGGMIYQDGRPHAGASHTAGEIGHIVVDHDGRICGCGGVGHLEAYASRTAIVRYILASMHLRWGIWPGLVMHVGSVPGSRFAPAPRKSGSSAWKGSLSSQLWLMTAKSQMSSSARAVAWWPASPSTAPPPSRPPRSPPRRRPTPPPASCARPGPSPTPSRSPTTR